MRAFGAVSAVATVLAGAALFASVVKADLDPIVIKVRCVAAILAQLHVRC